MPMTTRDFLKRRVDQIVGHIDWILYHLKEMDTMYEEAEAEYEGADYSEHREMVATVTAAIVQFSDIVDLLRGRI